MLLKMERHLHSTTGIMHLSLTLDHRRVWHYSKLVPVHDM